LAKAAYFLKIYLFIHYQMLCNKPEVFAKISGLHCSDFKVLRFSDFSEFHRKQFFQ